MLWFFSLAPYVHGTKKVKVAFRLTYTLIPTWNSIEIISNYLNKFWNFNQNKLLNFIQSIKLYLSRTINLDLVYSIKFLLIEIIFFAYKNIFFFFCYNAIKVHLLPIRVKNKSVFSSLRPCPWWFNKFKSHQTWPHFTQAMFQDYLKSLKPCI